MSSLTTIDNAVVIGSGLSVNSIGLLVSNSGSFGGNLAVTGNLTVTGFISAKPYASLRVSTGTAGATASTASVIGTPGPVTLAQYGFLTNVSVARGATAGASNYFIYTFTMPTAHPQGANYIVNGAFVTGSTSSASPNAFLTFNVTSSTSFTVWVRSSTNILLDGNFFVYTVP
jgi:hypothetical protein